MRDEIDSQVVIDFKEAFIAYSNREQRPIVEELISQSKLLKIKNTKYNTEYYRAKLIYKDNKVEEKRYQDYIASLIPENRNHLPSVTIYSRLLKGTRSLDNALTDDELVTITYQVFRFMLRSQKQGKL